MRTSSPTCLVITLIAVLILAFSLAGCSKEKPQETAKAAGPKFVQPTPPGTIRASHILVSYMGTPVKEATRSREEARELAYAILARIRKGEKFEDLAKTYSDDPSGETGGDLGFFGRGRMVRSFEDAAFALRPGEVSGVVETEYGYHIIKRTQ